MRRTVSVLALVVVVLTVGCSSGGSTKVLTPTQLKPALLTTADVGGKYRETSTSTTDASSSTDNTDSLRSIGGSPSCQSLFKQLSGAEKGINKATRKFKRSDGVTLESQATSARDSSKTLGQFRQVISTCKSFSVDQNGAKLNVRLQQADVPSLGGDSVGIKMHVSGDVKSGSASVHVSVDVFGIVIRRGASLAHVTITGTINRQGNTVPVTMNEITPLAKKADAKLAKVA